MLIPGKIGQDSNIPQIPSLVNPKLFRGSGTNKIIDDKAEENGLETIHDNLSRICTIAKSVGNILEYSISKANGILYHILSKYPNLTLGNDKDSSTIHIVNGLEDFQNQKNHFIASLKFLQEEGRLDDIEKEVTDKLIEHLIIFSDIYKLVNEAGEKQDFYGDAVLITFPEYFEQAIEWLDSRKVFDRLYHNTNPECGCSVNESTIDIEKDIPDLIVKKDEVLFEEEEKVDKGKGENELASKGLVPRKLSGIISPEVHDDKELGAPKHMGEVINAKAAGDSIFITDYCFPLDIKGYLNSNPIGLRIVNLPDFKIDIDRNNNQIDVRVPIYKTKAEDGVIKLPTPLNFIVTALGFEGADRKSIICEGLEVKQDLMGITYISNLESLQDDVKYIKYRLSPHTIELPEQLLDRWKQHFPITTQREETKLIDELLKIEKGDAHKVFELFRKKAAASQQIYTLNKLVHLTLKYAPNMFEAMESLGIIGECQKLATYWCNQARFYDVPAIVTNGYSVDYSMFRSDVGHAQVVYHTYYGLTACEVTKWSRESYQSDEKTINNDFPMIKDLILAKKEKELYEFLLSRRNLWRTNNREEYEKNNSWRPKDNLDKVLKVYEQTTDLLKATNIWESTMMQGDLKSVTCLLNEIIELSNDIQTFCTEEIQHSSLELPIHRIFKGFDQEKYIKDFIEWFYSKSKNNNQLQAELLNIFCSVKEKMPSLLRKNIMGEIFANLIEPEYIFNLSPKDLIIFQTELLNSDISESTKSKLLSTIGQKCKELGCLVDDYEVINKTIEKLTSGEITNPETIGNYFEYIKSLGKDKVETVFTKSIINIISKNPECFKKWLHACYQSGALSEYLLVKGEAVKLLPPISTNIAKAYKDYYFIEGIDHTMRKEGLEKGYITPDEKPMYDPSVKKVWTKLSFEGETPTLVLLDSIGIKLKDSLSKEEAIHLLDLFFFRGEGILVHDFNLKLDEAKLTSLTFDFQLEKKELDLEKIKQSSQNAILFCHYFGITEEDLLAQKVGYKKESKWITTDKSPSYRIDQGSNTERALVMALSRVRPWEIGRLFERCGLTFSHAEQLVKSSDIASRKVEKMNQDRGYCPSDYYGAYNDLSQILLKLNFPKKTLSRFFYIADMLNNCSWNDTLETLQEKIKEGLYSGCTDEHELKNEIIKKICETYTQNPFPEELRNELQELDTKELITLTTILSDIHLEYPSYTTPSYGRGRMIPISIFGGGESFTNPKDSIRQSGVNYSNDLLLSNCDRSSYSFWSGILSTYLRACPEGLTYLSEAGQCYPLIKEFSDSLQKARDLDNSSVFRNGRTTYATRLGESEIYARTNDGDLFQLDEQKGPFDNRRKAVKVSARTDKTIVIDTVSSVNINPHHLIVDIESLMPKDGEKLSTSVKNLIRILNSELGKRKTLYLHLFYRGNPLILYDTKSLTLQKALSKKGISDHLGKMTMREKFISELNYLAYLTKRIKDKEKEMSYSYIPGPICASTWVPPTKSGTVILFLNREFLNATLSKSRLLLREWHRKKHMDILLSTK